MTITENGQRDELADEMAGHPIGSGYYSTTVGVDEAREIADAILDDMERAFQRWNLAGWQRAGLSIAAHEPRLPVAVLWEPDFGVGA